MTKTLDVYIKKANAPVYGWETNRDGYSYSRKFHGVHRQVVRQWALKNNIGLKDGPKSGSIARRAANDSFNSQAWVELAPAAPGCKDGQCVGGYHFLTEQQVFDYCVDKLLMVPINGEIIERTIEVEKIVEVPFEVEKVVEVPVPFAETLTMEEVDILAFAFRDAEFTLNDLVREAMEENDSERALRLATRIDSLRKVMSRLGIQEATPEQRMLFMGRRLITEDPIAVGGAQLLLIPERRSTE